MEIKNIQIYTNESEYHLLEEERLKQILFVKNKLEEIIKNKFKITNDNPDLIIAIGGDRAFIKALRNNNFNRKPLYVGINMGTLGFLQEITESQIYELFYSIMENKFKIEKLSLAKLEINTNKNDYVNFALNEIIVREKDLSTLHATININGSCLELFSGDGIMISTPTGSSAHNKSAGGSIIYPSLKTLQITPLAPLDSRAYRSLSNSVIVPEDMTISLIPNKIHKENILIKIDGETLIIPHIEQINVTTDTQGINVLRFNYYDFWSRIKEKFL